jgi:hypothetical protein
MAELEGHPDPALFRQALKNFEEVIVELTNLDARMAELEALHLKNIGKQDPAFVKSLEKIVKGSPAFERAGMTGLRYSGAAGAGATKPKVTPTDLTSIMSAQREDIAVLIAQLQETVDALRGAIPAAEKGEFAALMLSGRSGFADRILQSVNLLGVFTRFYTRSCLTTIDATMQSYPSGLKWLKDSYGKPKRTAP